jgi:cell division cycle 20-like protein 1 (cofactor of APC complex)
MVYIRDVRAPADYTSALRGHKHEACGLRWSPDWSMLATGANDNKMLIWSAAYNKLNPLTGQTTPLWKFSEHKAAVKAIAWSPHQSGIIASGGGSHDRTIRFQSVATGEACGLIDVGAQVTQLAWAPHANELASTQGFSQNSLILWRYPSLSKVATLSGHQSRVLYMTVAPDGQGIVTGAADETLRFWNAFPGPLDEGKTEEVTYESDVLLPLSSHAHTMSPLMGIR